MYVSLVDAPPGDPSLDRTGIAMMGLAHYRRLWQFARSRLRSEEDYRAFQSYQAELLLGYLRERGIETDGSRVVDLGSGISGYGQQFARHGARVISIDFTHPSGTTNLGIEPVCANALEVPLPDRSVDFVFCASLIEHVDSPGQLLWEIQRVLKVGGSCYLSFPPFYSPMGGHEFAPFHYLGEKLALRLKKRRGTVPEWARQLYDASIEPESFADLYPRWGLCRMTIGKARRLLAATKLTPVDMSTRYMPLGFARWPLLGEILTWHVQFLVVRAE